MNPQPLPGKIGRTMAQSTPWWPPRPHATANKPNVPVVLFDDVGFADLGCYGATIRTPAIDALAARGVRLTGFHTTAVCSTTQAALLTGCNHHAVGMGCLANFDSGYPGYPGYRGKLAHEAATLPEMLRPHGFVNYMLGKRHVTPLNETGATGPFDGWPLGRGFARFYGFMDAETDQYAPGLVRDNTPIATPGSFASGRRTSRCLATAACGAGAGRRWPFTRVAKPSTPMCGSCTTWTMTLPRTTTWRSSSPHGFNNLISWSGLDIGLDRGSPVSHYGAPFAFTGTLRRVTVTLAPLPDAMSAANRDALAQVEMARQ